MEVKKEKGIVSVPVFMKNETEEVEYNYIVAHKGFEGNMMKRNKDWWITSKSKWVVIAAKTKKEAENKFELFVNKNLEKLKEKGYVS